MNVPNTFRSRSAEAPATVVAPSPRHLLLAVFVALTVQAGPSFARKTVPTEQTYMGYTGVTWTADYGVTRGRCDQAAIGKALSDPRTATPGQSPVATFAGVDLADVDRACAAQALELVRHGRTVRWKTASIAVGRDTVVRGLPCRPFVLHAGGRTTRGLACQAQRGVWEVTKP